MELSSFLVLIFQFFISLLISRIGSKRFIGAGWAFFFSMVFSIIIGLLAALGSGKFNPNQTYAFKRSRKDVVFAVFFFILAFACLCQFIREVSEFDLYSISKKLLVADLLVGFMGAGLYSFGFGRNKLIRQG